MLANAKIANAHLKPTVVAIQTLVAIVLPEKDAKFKRVLAPNPANAYQNKMPIPVK